MKINAFSQIKRRPAAAVAAVCGLMALAAPVATAKDPGYLAVIGPNAIRFVKPPEPHTNIVAAPEPVKPPPPVVKPPEAKPAPAAAIEAPAPKDTSADAAREVPSTPVSRDPAAAPDDVVSPQMLMKFFNNPSNAPAGNEWPAPTPGAGKSSATFTTAP